MTAKTPEDGTTAPAKKPYVAPHLETYGGLNDITRAATTSGGKGDGAMGAATNKT